MRVQLDVEYPDFDQFANRVSNVTPFLREIKHYLRGSRKHHQARGQDPYGQPYAPLSPMYARRKRATWGKKPILIASGEMVEGYRSSITGATLVESYPSPAGYHQAGTTTMPQRLLFPTAALGLPTAQKKRFRQIALAHIERAGQGLRTVKLKV